MSSLFKLAFQSKLSKFEKSPLWKHYLEVPSEIIRQVPDSLKRFDVKVNNSIAWTTAIMKTKTFHFILLNDSRVKQLGLSIDSLVEIELTENTSKYGIEMPEQLQMELDQDEAVSTRFESLTPGNQRTIINIVIKVKNPESRTKKAKAISHLLFEMTDNKVDYKRLNELIKFYNNFSE